MVHSMGFATIFFFFTTIALAVLYWLEKKTRDRITSESNQRISELEESNSSLSKYQGILEIDQEITARRQSIESDELIAKEKIISLINEAEANAKELKSEARRIKKDAQEHHSTLIESATRKSARIVEEAGQKAEEVAGDAIIALRDSRRLEETVKAIKNTINGYGAEYLKPASGLLDDLADEFSHKDAGVELKAAREHSRSMVDARLAAECDYAAENRKSTAINFVLDAFNGKVESILVRSKHDNYGQLEQEIIDAYNIVNSNGTAFRNARIREAYRDARLEELRLSVIVHELKQLERAEQKAIREQMREEERARKEYEKAIKEAAKEERLIQKALEKARKELLGSTQEQKAKYERQLEELELKLAEAEEKNQRAVSMAQQTKQGHVYVISNVGSFGDDVFKIGLTRRLDPEDRVNELGDASVPFRFDIHAMLFSEDAPSLESRLHSLFREHQVNLANPRKEFFRISLSEIKKAVNEYGIDSKWTMVAEAHEYRETLAILKSKGHSVRELPSLDSEQNLINEPSPISVGNVTRNSVVTNSPDKSEVKNQIGLAEKISPLTERSISCPACKGAIKVSMLKHGANTCPHCQKTFNVKAKKV